MTISVLLVEDHRLVREALRHMLAKEPDIHVIGEAGDATTAVERVRSLKPDVVVLDIGLADLNGAAAASAMKQRAGVNPKIVALSASTNGHFVTETLRAGASSYVTKSSAGTDLIRAIRAVASGQTYICPEAGGALASAMRDTPEKGDAPRLSRREREVLRLIAEGTRSPSIAGQLHITLGTVEVHRRNIMRKLGLRTVAHLTRYAVREGLVLP